MRHDLSGELEALLYQERQGSHSNTPPQFDSWSQSLDRQSSNPDASSSLSQPRSDIYSQIEVPNFSGFPHSTQNSGALAAAIAKSATSDIGATFFANQFEPTFDFLTGVDGSVNEQLFSCITSQSEQPIKEGVVLPSGPSPESEMIWANWPPNLPPPDLLRHLCDSTPPSTHTLRLAYSFLASKCFSRFTTTRVASSTLPVSWLHFHSLLLIHVFLSLLSSMPSVPSARCILP